MKYFIAILGSLFGCVLLFVVFGLSISGVFLQEYIDVVTNPVFTGIMSPLLIVLGMGLHDVILEKLEEEKE